MGNHGGTNIAHFHEDFETYIWETNVAIRMSHRLLHTSIGQGDFLGES
jgi:hypothetical protein